LAITKSRKQALVGEYREMLVRSRGVVLAAYTGLSVTGMEELRRKLREQGSEFHVVKNRLAKLAFREAGLPVPEDALSGSTVIGFAPEDVTALVKAIVEAAKASEFVRVKAGVFDGVLYTGRQVEMLAELPPLPVLQARLIGVIQAPASRLAGALAGAARKLVGVAKAYAETGAPA
jgi:large subunit ribosomal protein L10